MVQARNDENMDVLVKRFNRRDTKAFVAVYSAFFDELHAYAIRLFKDMPTAPEDAVQDVFCWLWEDRSRKFETLVRLKAFLYVMLKNRYLHEVEHLKVEERHHEAMEHEANFAEEVRESERVVRLREYVERMPEPERGIIKMYLDGYEPGEIAERLKMSVQTIYNLKSRAVNFLRRLFGQKSPGDGEA